MANPSSRVSKCRLAAVNFFLGMVGIVQCTRIAVYRATHRQKEALPQPVEAADEPKTAQDEN